MARRNTVKFKRKRHIWIHWCFISFRRLNEKGNFDWEQNSTTDVNISEWNSLISGGSIFDGSYVGLVAPSASTKAGKYVLSHFSISDKADNSKILMLVHLLAMVLQLTHGAQKRRKHLETTIFLHSVLRLLA